MDGEDRLFWAEQRIRTLLLQRGPMVRRNLQSYAKSRVWSSDDFNTTLDEMIRTGIVEMRGRECVLIDTTPPMTKTQARREVATKSKVTVSHATLRRAAIWDKTDGRCWYCGRRMNPFRDFNVDHVVPLSRGGTDDIGNVVPACASCNFVKRGKSVDSFRQMYPRGYRFFFEHVQTPQDWDETPEQ